MENKNWVIELAGQKTGQSLFSIIREMEIPLEAACNGRGICGNCRVRIMKGVPGVTEKESHIFSQKQLDEGWRLACCHKVSGPMEVWIPKHDTARLQTPSSDIAKQAVDLTVSGPNASIAVDLGTTTLAAVLLDENGKAIAQKTGVNSQRRFGADVLSRIQASEEGHGKELQNIICRDLEDLFQALIKEAAFNKKISRIAIAGNTTMLHLLRGYSCKGLGQAPFTPVSIQQETLPCEQVFSISRLPQTLQKSQVYLLPGLSTFVGADIAAGLYHSGFLQVPGEAVALFLDIGTNGEMAVGSGCHFLSASAAAGPAFEGGRLRDGVPGIPGAVSGVSMLYGRFKIQTIGQKRPCGICGSGALEALALLLKKGLIDKNGTLLPVEELSRKGIPVFSDGTWGVVLAKTPEGREIGLTQGDIRQLQLAKAAIRAGIETLFQRYGEQTGQEAVPKEIYLAGGFGYYISPAAAVTIGLFAPEWEPRIRICGNTSLQGAVDFLYQPGCEKKLARLKEINQELSLAGDKIFEELYLKQMQFFTDINK